MTFENSRWISKWLKRIGLLGLASVVVFATLLFLVLPGTQAERFHDGFEQSRLMTSDWQVDADDDCRIHLSSQQAREGDQSVSIDAPRDSRCELVPRIFPAILDKFLREPYGESRWYRFSVLVKGLGDAPPTDDLGENTIIAQWHSSPDPLISEESGRGPSLALRIHNGGWAITYGWDENFRSTGEGQTGYWQWVGPVDPGQWVDWQAHVRWSYGDDGLTEIWRDGQPVLQRLGPNTYNDIRGVYLKLGIYHPTDDMAILLDRVSIGGSRNSNGES